MLRLVTGMNWPVFQRTRRVLLALRSVSGVSTVSALTLSKFSFWMWVAGITRQCYACIIHSITICKHANFIFGDFVDLDKAVSFYLIFIPNSNAVCTYFHSNLQQPFVDACLKNGNKAEAQKYAYKVKDENKVTYFIKCG